MKIGIISDIHSNIYAFKACTEYMEKHKCDDLPACVPGTSH